MADGMTKNSETILQNTARHVNCLSEENKNTRKRALEGIKKETVGLKPIPGKDVLEIVFKELYKHLLNCFSDPAERNRELSIEITRQFYKNVPCPSDFLPYTVPVLVQRLGQQDIVEGSEEIRLNLVEFLAEILAFSDKRIHVYLDDNIRILVRTIVDPYPEVRKISCINAGTLAKKIPEYFSMQSESLIKPLLQSLTHQHSRVRTVVVSAIGDVLQYGNGKNVDDVVSHLAQRLFDQAPTVRQAVITVVGNWLLDLPDRYSFHHKLIPLLLSGLTDEMPDIAKNAEALWHDAGLKYVQENDDEFKDQQSFTKAPPSHYPKGVERPNLGCRILIFRNFSKIGPACVRDLTDWVVATRIKASQLLYYILLNNEEFITQHMEMLIMGSVKACMDEEKEVVENVGKAVELIGYFVPPDVWTKLVLANVRNTQSFGSIMVLGCITRGCDRGTIKPFIGDICDTLVEPDVCQSSQSNVQLQLLAVVEAILDVCKEDCGDNCFKLFKCLMTVMALCTEQEVSKKVNELLSTLCRAEGLDSVTDLYSKYTRTLLETFETTYKHWTTYSGDRVLFDSLLMAAGPVVGENLDLVVKIFRANLATDKEPELRLKFFSLLSRLVLNASETVNSKDSFGNFSLTVVQDMVLPNCVWKAGRTAGAIRSIAVSCIWAMLKSEFLSKEHLLGIRENLLSQLITLLEDDNKTTRLTTCYVLTRVFTLLGQDLEQGRLHNIYPELLKRLDDSNDEIRIAVSKTFIAYFGCFEGSYDVGLYKAHLEAIYKGLLVHLDDPDTKIQEAILEILKKAAPLKPSMLQQEIEFVKHKHRSPKYCEMLSDHLRTMKLETS